MTDQPSCLATYKSDTQIQLDKAHLTIGLRGRGGLQTYQLRWDNEPAEEMQLPSDIEKEAGAFIVPENEFRHIGTSKRLRIQVLTLISGIANFDINLSGVTPVMAALRGPKCT